ncbi:glycosyltransferase family 2 protein [Conyzicola sp.]|uniref:glycosyltransferase family 2 protein n=1 Tax=Conyzicola sp. TaxID=1969404 RepID=UPI003988C3EF
MMSSAGAFRPHGDAIDIAVAVVTFNNADHLPGLLASLRSDVGALRVRVIVADNGSTDGTDALLAAEPDVVTVPTGGNRGYAAGINLALRRAGDARAVLVLNPDLTVARGALAAMLDRLGEPGVGAVVPRIESPDGTTYPSLRREPTIVRSVGDALLGSRAGDRPAWSSEIDGAAGSYLSAHPVDWATGAAVMVRREATTAVGAWDARFFLYSEETDYLRRMRDAGFAVWYEPRALVVHDGAGSGSSSQLAALMAVNRVRYVRKHRSPRYAAAFHATVILHELLRAYDPTHRDVLRAVADQRSWPRLPRATRWPVAAAGRSTGAVIVPAHNEAAVIPRTLRVLAPLAAEGRVEVIVVCNGCSDATAEIARGFEGVRVVETPIPSKTTALNLGDLAAGSWPRLYLDADVEIHPGAIAAVFAALDSDVVLAARPAFRYVTAGASPLVRAYYRARDRLPSAHRSLWGAGAYALNEKGHARIGRFADKTADDLIVNAAFASHEKAVVATEPIRVHTPKNRTGLLAVLTRQRRGNTAAGTGSTTSSTLKELWASVRGPFSLGDAVAFGALTLAGRRAARRASAGTAWERDDSSRDVPSVANRAPHHGQYRPPRARATPARSGAAGLDGPK